MIKSKKFNPIQPRGTLPSPRPRPAPGGPKDTLKNVDGGKRKTGDRLAPQRDDRLIKGAGKAARRRAKAVGDTKNARAPRADGGTKKPGKKPRKGLQNRAPQSAAS